MGRAMSDQKEDYSATELLDRHPELRKAMSESGKFAELKAGMRPPLNIDGEELYFGLYGDVPVNEDELYIRTLLQGASRPGAGDIYSEMFEELPEELKLLIGDLAGKRGPGPAE